MGEPVGEYLRKSSECASSAPSGVADDSLLPSENHEAIPCIERALPLKGWTRAIRVGDLVQTREEGFDAETSIKVRSQAPTLFKYSMSLILLIAFAYQCAFSEANSVNTGLDVLITSICSRT